MQALSTKKPQKNPENCNYIYACHLLPCHSQMHSFDMPAGLHMHLSDSFILLVKNHKFDCFYFKQINAARVSKSDLLRDISEFIFK